LKSKLFISFLLLLVVTPAFGQLLSDKTGLVNRLDVKTGGYAFEVETVANFDIQDFKFDESTKWEDGVKRPFFLIFKINYFAIYKLANVYLRIVKNILFYSYNHILI
jgi:hypothetical protein